MLTIYDVHSDENVPATQADVDALVRAASSGAMLRHGLERLAADARAWESDVPLLLIERLLASVEAKPAA